MDIVRLWGFSQRGRWKNTFVEGKEGGIIEKRTKTNRGMGEGPNICVRSLFQKKNAEIFKMKFHSYSPVFPIGYNGSMKY